MTYYSPGSREDEIISKKLKRMGKTSDKNIAKEDSGKRLFKPKGRIKKTIGILAIILLLAGGVLFYKTSSLMSRISISSGSIFGGLFKGTEDVKGMEDGRINILLIGMRGTNIPGGSLLADTIMVISIKAEENKIAMISIPRDLYVAIPGKNYSRKINEANVIGEENGKSKGLELMKETVGNVTGLPIHYAISANFDALRDTVDVMGGITVHLDKPFYEGEQFVEGDECGGEFSLEAGDIKLNGETALCYTRARFATSDFDRARRQQEVLLSMKNKALSVGTLSDFGKLNDLTNVMGNNIRTDMKSWEMQKLFGILKGVEGSEVYHKVFDTSKEGLLYSTSNGSYILLPVGDNYNEIHQVCADIFEEER
ncbi:MAG: LCP family protein [Patescibacteria group bacterium]|nr:LCP family protein [Patescibacteria group bacterium]